MIRKLSRGFIFQGFINCSVISIVTEGVFIKFIFIIPVSIAEVKIQTGIFTDHFGKSPLQAGIGKEPTASISFITDFISRTAAATIKEAIRFQTADPQVETELTKRQEFSRVTQIMSYKSTQSDIKTVGFVALICSLTLA